MTSQAKIDSNRRNAARSTGPRTAGGKARSCMNALRHGLAVPIERASANQEKIESLTALLADSNDPLQIEKARATAVYHLDRERMRAIREDQFEKLSCPAEADGAQITIALEEIKAVTRYEIRAAQKRKRAMRDR